MTYEISWFPHVYGSEPILLPEGWEPFSTEPGGVWLRRRVAESTARPLPVGVDAELAERRRATYNNRG